MIPRSKYLARLTLTGQSSCNLFTPQHLHNAQMSSTPLRFIFALSKRRAEMLILPCQDACGCENHATHNQLFSHCGISQDALSYSEEGLMPRGPCRALYAADGQTRVPVIDPVSERAPCGRSSTNAFVGLGFIADLGSCCLPCQEACDVGGWAYSIALACRRSASATA